MAKKLTIILDAAHGSDVPGKCSPDGFHREYKWSREIIGKLKPLLEASEYKVFLTAPEETEPGLSVRVKRANAVPGSPKLLISLHNNAAGMGTAWLNASGVAIYTTPGQTHSDKYADIILNQLQADFPGIKFRKDFSDGDQDFEANFTVLTGNTYSAVLLEWLFQDNRLDLQLIEDSIIKQKLIISLIKSVNTIESSL